MVDDPLKIIDRGGRSIARMNDAEDFGVELLEIDVAADLDE